MEPPAIRASCRFDCLLTGGLRLANLFAGQREIKLSQTGANE